MTVDYIRKIYFLQKKNLLFIQDFFLRNDLAFLKKTRGTSRS